jgi:hypothetical protein
MQSVTITHCQRLFRLALPRKLDDERARTIDQATGFGDPDEVPILIK